MGLSKIAEKLDDHYDRVKAGKAAKIKPRDVEKAIAKLESRERALLVDLEETEKASKIERLKKKLDTTRDMISRAKWLLEEVS
ncbi:hypothetical protein [Roseovarius sp. 2305UL8-3]|uniref:hypothetical protein n=1 Tax=Roseovarius conchicola TaxID=3121636 RepID=UPI0035273FEF